MCLINGQQGSDIMSEKEDVEILTEGPLAEAIQAAAVDGENTIEECFITDSGQAVSSDFLQSSVIRQSFKSMDSEKLYAATKQASLLDISKSVAGTTQSEQEIGRSGLGESLRQVKIVEPPYPPELLAQFLEVDETHFRCVKTKVTDAVGRDYIFDPIALPNGRKFDPAMQTDEDRDKIDSETAQIQMFIEECNDIIGFDGVLERAGMDFEAIGWAAIEVIRSRDMKIRRISHIPASRVRVLRGWKGFVEVLGQDKHVYYQPFGQKVTSRTRKDPFTNKPEPFAPTLDGELSPSNLDWNMIDRKTGKPSGDFSTSANEIVWIPKHHASTIYYGIADIVAALGYVLANIHIRDFQLQYFEHNTVPRYAIIIEGAKLAEPVKKAITEYFGTHVKGKAHKTLIIPIPAMRGEVKVRFEKLDADVKESSFLESRKSNAQSIMAAHGVSPAIIGIAEHSELGSGKGLSQAEIYKDRIVTPSQRRWETFLNRLFRLGLGVQLVAMKFNPLDIRDREAEMDIYTGYLEKGTISINQVRKRVGLGDPVEGGDRQFYEGAQGVVFIDELNEQGSADKQELEDEIEGLRQQIAMRQQASASSPKPADSESSPKPAAKNDDSGKK